MEQERLRRHSGVLEESRTREIIEQYLPAPPARVLDVGGGPGAYALWLAGLGLHVHLIDLMPGHGAQAREASRAQPLHPLAGCAVGDARNLANHADQSVDVMLMLGPLYHLIERDERLAAWREAGRVLRPGGVVIAAAISRFASALDGLFRNLVADDAFFDIMREDLRSGAHRNPGNHPQYFTTSYFHRPAELAQEIVDAGLAHVRTIGVEGPGWLLSDVEARWNDPRQRERIRIIVQAMAEEPEIIGVSAHVLAIAQRR
jgi:ubiquinone/menaquinone biosynthesis C-methylase UbiE